MKSYRIHIRSVCAYIGKGEAMGIRQLIERDSTAPELKNYCAFSERQLSAGSWGCWGSGRAQMYGLCRITYRECNRNTFCYIYDSLKSLIYQSFKRFFSINFRLISLFIRRLLI